MAGQEARHVSQADANRAQRLQAHCGASVISTFDYAGVQLICDGGAVPSPSAWVLSCAGAACPRGRRGGGRLTIRRRCHIAVTEHLAYMGDTLLMRNKWERRVFRALALGLGLLG
nr:hypothetical protein [Cupriavidus basilensis]